MFRRSRSRGGIAIVLAVAAMALSVVPAAARGAPDFVTPQPSMLTVMSPGGSATPLITVGETIDGWRFESIPDGISVRRGGGEGNIIAYVNHETSTVPFPYTPAAPTEANSQNDFDNSQLSRIVLSTTGLEVISGSFAIPSSANYQRFCSNFMAGRSHGFAKKTLFTGEEATDFVSRTGQAWQHGQPTTEPPSEQAGVVVVYNPANGNYKTIHSMGRLNHENSVAIPGYAEPVVLTTDDTFSTNPASSQLYLYNANSRGDLMRDQGTLYGLKLDDAAFNDYYDFGPGSTASKSGTFVAIDPAAASGPQAGLEADSDAKGVFQFVRLEDVAYDRTNPNVVYMADSGRAASSDPTNPFPSTNGRIWRLELDPTNPLVVTSLRILIEGEGTRLKDPTAIHQPDNLESTTNSLLITEDPSSANQFASTDTSSDATTARIWLYDFVSGTKRIVARVDQSSDENTTDVDSAVKGNQGAWEASGIIDVSRFYGPGSFLVDIQAHSLWVEKAPGPDDTGPTSGTPDGLPDFTYKREGGQLLLIRIPGA